MLFSSFEFILVFLPATLVAYFLALRLSRVFALVVLLIASLIFYGYWSPPHTLLIVSSVIFNFALGRWLLHLGRQRRKATVAFVVGISLNLGLIAYFKYADFFISNYNAALGKDTPLLHVVLPLAISFFTFQQVMFLADVRSGKITTIRPLHYALYIVFFPQLIAGPIVHYLELVPQFLSGRSGRRVRIDLAIGLTIFAIGLFKKVVLADSFGVLSDRFFDSVERDATITFWEAWGGALAYSFQIYFDFSGYSDMAVGLARMFGWKLPMNFFSPYKAASIIEFWRRWHITLSRFLRDYLYVPLGGSRAGSVRRYANLLLTMLIGGLWHGASWNFVIWGGLHGAFLMVNHGWRLLGVTLSINVPMPRFLGVAVTFLAVVVAWVFFRVQDNGDALRLVAIMFGAEGINLPGWSKNFLGPASELLAGAGVNFTQVRHFSGIPHLGMIIIALLIVFFLPNTVQVMRRYQVVLADRFLDAQRRHRPTGTFLDVRLAWLWEWRPNFLSALWVAGMAALAILFLLPGNEKAFVYFQF